MTPWYLQETFLRICIIIGAIVGIAGIIGLITHGPADKYAWICTALGAAVFIGFLFVRRNQDDHEKGRPDKDSGQDDAL